jgi:rhodanese-related sulfurtransferase
MQAISRNELKNMNENHRDFVLINVLSPDDFNKKHIRTSINIPVKDANFAKRVEEVAGDKERDIIVYCANFDCPASTDAANALDKAGFRNTYDYEGGTQDWFDKTEH